MKILLDSHVFLWMARDPAKLSAVAREHFQRVDNVLLLSIASLWEIQIKAQLEKLTLLAPLPDIFREQVRVNKIELLYVEPDHIFALSQLPGHHRDPFDRLLIAQSFSEQVPIMSHDAVFTQYPVQIIW